MGHELKIQNTSYVKLSTNVPKCETSQEVSETVFSFQGSTYLFRMFTLSKTSF